MTVVVNSWGEGLQLHREFSPSAPQPPALLPTLCLSPPLAPCLSAAGAAAAASNSDRQPRRCQLLEPPFVKVHVFL